MYEDVKKYSNGGRSRGRGFGATRKGGPPWLTGTGIIGKKRGRGKTIGGLGGSSESKSGDEGSLTFRERKPAATRKLWGTDEVRYEKTTGRLHLQEEEHPVRPGNFNQHKMNGWGRFHGMKRYKVHLDRKQQTRGIPTFVQRAQRNKTQNHQCEKESKSWFHTNGPIWMDNTKKLLAPERRATTISRHSDAEKTWKRLL